MHQIKIDSEERQMDDRTPTGEQILALVDKKYPEWTLSLILGDKSISVSKEQKVDLAEIGNGFFKSESSKSGRPDRKGADLPVRVKIDGDEYAISDETLTGEQILALAGKNYNEWSLNKKLKSGRRVKVEKEAMVDLTDSELDRFETAPLQAQQGGVIWRR